MDTRVIPRGCYCAGAGLCDGSGSWKGGFLMDELNVKLVLVKENAQLVSSLRRLGYASDEVTAEAARSLRVEMELLLSMLRDFDTPKKKES